MSEVLQQQNDFQDSENEVAQDFSNAIIANQNNFYSINQNKNIVLFSIDTDLLTKWHEDKSTDIHSILEQISDLNQEYIKNNKLEIKVETTHLLKLQNLRQSSNSDRIEINNNIKNELKKCEKIKILLKIINLDRLSIGTAIEINTTIQILYNLCNRIFFPDSIIYISREIYTVDEFLREVGALELDIDHYMSDYLKEWEQEIIDDEFINIKRHEIEEERENFKKHLLMSQEVFEINKKIKDKVVLFSSNFQRFNEWINIPFCCIVKLENNIEFTIFNVFLTRIKKIEDILKYECLFSKDYHGNVLVDYYTRLISSPRYKYGDDFENFFNHKIKEIRVEHDPRQKKLIKIKQLYFPIFKGSLIDKIWRNNMFKASPFLFDNINKI